jgi:hypothetical protein
MLNNADGDKEDFLLLVVAFSPSAKKRHRRFQTRRVFDRNGVGLCF